MFRQAFTALLLVLAQTSLANVVNGDFENWSGTTPDGWTTIDSGITLAVSSNSQQGSTAAEVTVTTATQASTDLLQNVAVVSGESYDFSVWVYHTDGGVRARLYVDGYRVYADPALTNQWQQLSYRYTATATGNIAVGLRFYDISGSFDGSEVVYVDNFEPLSGTGNSDTGNSCTDTELALTTDNYGSETSWTLTDGDGNEVDSGSGYAANSSQTVSWCLDDGDYTFTINDSYGDGICCTYGSGSYQISAAGDVVASGGQFSSSEVTSFTLGAADSSGSGGSGGSDGGSGGSNGSCSHHIGTLALTTDNYGSETSWTITNGSGATVASGSGYSSNSNHTEALCLEQGDYTFTIMDSYGDGLCCTYGNGAYSLTFDTLVANGSSFGSSESTTFSLSGSSSGGSGVSDLSGYYAAANGFTGYQLKSALHGIIKTGHSVQGYAAIWTFYDQYERDTYYEADGSILDIYTENPTGTDTFSYADTSDQCVTFRVEGDCYSREHSFPKSWFGGTVEPMNSDVHHIFAADGYVNSRRNSFPYGVVGSATYTSSNGGQLGSAAAGLGYSGTVFEPIDEFKGDLARAYFYMATRYEDIVAGWETNSSRGDTVLDGSADQVYESWFLSLLLSWHNSDPVSQKEIDRNNAIYGYQGNRNPFVDHPELVGEIWGN